MSLELFHLAVAACYAEYASRKEPLRLVMIVSEEPAQEPEDERCLLSAKLRPLLELSQTFSEDIVRMNYLMNNLTLIRLIMKRQIDPFDLINLLFVLLRIQRLLLKVLLHLTPWQGCQARLLHSDILPMLH